MTLDIPAFLRIPQADRKAAWKGHRVSVQGSGFKAAVTKVEEAATRKLRKELEAQQEAKKAARLAALRELRARV